MECRKCQFENPEDSFFCNECGARLEIACLECGRVNPPGSKFCNKCGHKLPGPEKTPAIDDDKPGSYTPEPLADKMFSDREQIEYERKLVTVFFADVANYISISGKLDPEEVHNIIDGWYKIVMAEVHRYDGTITQFTGDGVMALFGAPVAHEDHERRACHASSAIQDDVKEYRKKVKKEYGVDFKMRIALNSGLVKVAKKMRDIELVAPVAAGLCFSYSATGEYSKILEVAPDVIALLEKSNIKNRPFVILCSLLGLAKGHVGDFHGGEYLLEKGHIHATETDDIFSLSYNEMCFGVYYMVKGAGKLAVKHLKNSIINFEKLERPRFSGMGWGGLGSGYYLMGDLATARKYQEKILKTHIDSRIATFQSSYYHYYWLSLCLCDSGDLKKAESFAQRALKLSQKDIDKSYEGMSLILLGKIWGKADPSKRDKAKESIGKGIKVLEKMKLRPFVSSGYLCLGEFYADTGQKDKARETLEKALGMMEEMGMIYWPDRAREVLARL